MIVKKCVTLSINKNQVYTNYKDENSIFFHKMVVNAMNLSYFAPWLWHDESAFDFISQWFQSMHKGISKIHLFFCSRHGVSSVFIVFCCHYSCWILYENHLSYRNVLIISRKRITSLDFFLFFAIIFELKVYTIWNSPPPLSHSRKSACCLGFFLKNIFETFFCKKNFLICHIVYIYFYNPCAILCWSRKKKFKHLFFGCCLLRSYKIQSVRFVFDSNNFAGSWFQKKTRERKKIEWTREGEKKQ